MTDNVIHLPRPQADRAGGSSLAFFVRVGWSDHKEVLELMAAGEAGIFGFVIDANIAQRHRDLITECRKRDFDVILDPKTQQMALPGSYSDSIASLPWAKTQQHHRLSDFDGAAGEARAKEIVDFALRHNFTQILGPSHLIGGPNDPWLRRDIDTMRQAKNAIEQGGNQLGLIYSLALPIAVLRDDTLRSAIIASIDDVPCDAIWLKTENFGDDATGEKAVAYIKACQDFHARGIPLVADHVGGLPGLGALAFGAVGGIAHGVTVNQSFKASSWRRPPQEGSGGGGVRVYLPQLDMLIKRSTVKEFLTSSQRVRGRHVCKDTHCCGRGVIDMLDRPARHALYQRAREIEKLSTQPESVRVPTYLDTVRRVSDEVALAASFEKIDPELREKLQCKQKKLGHYRDAIAHMASTKMTPSTAISPVRRSARKQASK